MREVAVGMNYGEVADVGTAVDISRRLEWSSDGEGADAEDITDLRW